MIMPQHYNKAGIYRIVAHCYLSICVCVHVCVFVLVVSLRYHLSQNRVSDSQGLYDAQFDHFDALYICNLLNSISCVLPSLQFRMNLDVNCTTGQHQSTPSTPDDNVLPLTSHFTSSKFCCQTFSSVSGKKSPRGKIPRFLRLVKVPW